LRIILADDHQIVLEALDLSLSAAGFQVVGTATSHAQTLQVCLRLKPDVLLLDILMPAADGLETARELRSQLPSCRIIFLSSSRSPLHLARARLDGMEGFLSKHAPRDELVQAILDVAAGKRVFDPTLMAEAGKVHSNAERTESNAAGHAPVAPLSRQENLVLKLISAGLSNAEMAALLNLSVQTVKTHVQHIFAKIGVSSRTSAAIWAIRTGRVSLEEISPSFPLEVTR
ncbi:MAG: response regulator transcription factor, partial [Anaerolineales bacterium]